MQRKVKVESHSESAYTLQPQRQERVAVIMKARQNMNMCPLLAQYGIAQSECYHIKGETLKMRKESKKLVSRAEPRINKNTCSRNNKRKNCVEQGEFSVATLNRFAQKLMVLPMDIKDSFDVTGYWSKKK